MIENVSEPIGNPITLLLERIAYGAIGLFFIVAFLKAIQKGRDDKY